VLGDGGAAHFEVCSNVADRALGFGEQIQHLASRRMADRCEHIGLAIGSHHHVAIIRKQLLTCQAQVYPLSESNAMTVEAEWLPGECSAERRRTAEFSDRLARLNRRRTGAWIARPVRCDDWFGPAPRR
jgi:hypothetical protein